MSARYKICGQAMSYLPSDDQKALYALAEKERANEKKVEELICKTATEFVDYFAQNGLVVADIIGACSMLEEEFMNEVYNAAMRLPLQRNEECCGTQGEITER